LRRNHLAVASHRGISEGAEGKGNQSEPENQTTSAYPMGSETAGKKKGDVGPIYPRSTQNRAGCRSSIEKKEKTQKRGVRFIQELLDRDVGGSRDLGGLKVKVPSLRRKYGGGGGGSVNYECRSSSVRGALADRETAQRLSVAAGGEGSPEKSKGPGLCRCEGKKLRGAIRLRRLSRRRQCERGKEVSI